MSDLFYGEWTRHVPLRHKILRIEWPMVVLIAILACIGFAMLFSAAGGHLSPWANRQMFRFCAGLIVLDVVACIDLPAWMGLAYPAYAVLLFLLFVVPIQG